MNFQHVVEIFYELAKLSDKEEVSMHELVLCAKEQGYL